MDDRSKRDAQEVSTTGNLANELMLAAIRVVDFEDCGEGRAELPCPVAIPDNEPLADATDPPSHTFEANPGIEK